MRRQLAGLLASVPALVIVVSGLALKNSLRRELSTHWDDAGRVDGTSSTWTLFWTSFGIASFIAVLTFVLGVDERRPASSRPGLLIGGAFSGGAAAVWVFAAGINLSSPPGQDPRVGAWPLAFIGVVYGVVPMIATLGGPEGRRPRQPLPLTAEPAVVRAWVRNVDSPRFAVASLSCGAVVAVILLASGAFDDPDVITFATSAILLVLLAITVSLSRLRVMVDHRGLLIVSRISRLRLKRIALSSMVDARAEEILPLRWGGWGYRIMPGRSAIVLGRGSGIVISKCNGSVFAVTVDEPEEGVALLVGLLRARSDPETP